MACPIPLCFHSGTQNSFHGQCRSKTLRAARTRGGHPRRQCCPRKQSGKQSIIGREHHSAIEQLATSSGLFSVSSIGTAVSKGHFDEACRRGLNQTISRSVSNLPSIRAAAIGRVLRREPGPFAEVAMRNLSTPGCHHQMLDAPFPEFRQYPKYRTSKSYLGVENGYLGNLTLNLL